MSSSRPATAVSTATLQCGPRLWRRRCPATRWCVPEPHSLPSSPPPLPLALNRGRRMLGLSPRCAPESHNLSWPCRVQPCLLPLSCGRAAGSGAVHSMGDVSGAQQCVGPVPSYPALHPQPGAVVCGRTGGAARSVGVALGRAPVHVPVLACGVDVCRWSPLFSRCCVGDVRLGPLSSGVLNSVKHDRESDRAAYEDDLKVCRPRAPHPPPPNARSLAVPVWMTFPRAFARLSWALF